MADDFKVGDVAVRVSDFAGLMPIGTMRRVREVWYWDGDDEPGVALEFVGDPPDQSWYASAFRKLPPADDAFVLRMREMKPCAPTTVREREKEGV